MNRQQRANGASSRSRRKSRNAKHRVQPQHTEPYLCLVAGAVTLGIGAALVGGSAIAHADGTASGSSSSSSDNSAGPSSSRSPRSSRHESNTSGNTSMPTGADTAPAASTSTGSRDRLGAAAPAAHSARGRSPSSESITASPSNKAGPSLGALSTGPTEPAANDGQPPVDRSAAAQLTRPAGLSSGLVSKLPSLSGLNPPVSTNPAAPTAPALPTLLAEFVSLAFRRMEDQATLLFGQSPSAQPVQSGQLTSGVVTGSPGAGASAGYPSNATVPLQINNVTEPVVKISVNGGRSAPVLVDTGSAGLVIGLRDLGLQNLSFPTGFGVGSYSGGLVYLYATLKGKVNFGNGIVTAPTPVNVVLLSFPQSFEGFLAGAGADGVLGIGPNAVGPGPSIVTTALPGDLGQGVLIDALHGVLVFGPNPLPTRVSVPGSPNSTLQVQVGDAPLRRVSVLIDSGGVYGTIPSSVAGSGLSPGTVISVYTSDGQTLLYSYTITATNAPTVTSGSFMNTGYIPFAQQPVYISYSPSGEGTTTFDEPS